MKFYLARDGSIHGLEPDGSQDREIRPDWVALTPDQVAASRATDPKAAALAQIRALEVDQLLPRATREFMLLTMEADYTPEQLAQLAGYVKLKAFDTQIAALRAIVRGES